MKKLPYNPDAPAWAIVAHPYPLPAGLAHRTPVRFRGPGLDDLHVMVEDQSGKTWELMHINVDTGFEYLIEGRYVPEHAPAALKYLFALVNNLDVPSYDQPVQADVEATIKSACLVLERNGVKAPTLISGRHYVEKALPPEITEWDQTSVTIAPGASFGIKPALAAESLHKCRNDSVVQAITA